MGDREFHSVELASWLQGQKISFVFRQKQSTTFREKVHSFQPLNSIPISPGVRQFYTNINLTQKSGKGRFNLAVYWKRKYRGKQEDEVWYLLTNLPDSETAIGIYRQRFGIEAMFRDCKTGGYNLEGSKANPDKLVRLILIIAISLTSAWLHGQRTKFQGQELYVCRLQEERRTRKRHSDFWIGLYAQAWLDGRDLATLWLESWMQLSGNKQSYLQRGLDAASRLQTLF